MVLTANDSFIRTKIKGKMVVVTGKFIKTISEIVMHAKPYQNVAEIETIDTNLNGCWKYSPLFKHPYPDDYISLPQLADNRMS